MLRPFNVVEVTKNRVVEDRHVTQKTAEHEKPVELTLCVYHSQKTENNNELSKTIEEVVDS